MFLLLSPLEDSAVGTHQEPELATPRERHKHKCLSNSCCVSSVFWKQNDSRKPEVEKDHPSALELCTKTIIL
jgi:hypothetical protein